VVFSNQPNLHNNDYRGLSMKLFIQTGTALALLASALSDTLAQTPEEQTAQAQAMQQLQRMPFMRGMQELQARYRKIKEERAQERKAITDAIYEEEFARAKQQQVSGTVPDPYAASEWARRGRMP
jgi:hypothetical protein